MKSFFKLFGIIALVSVIGFSIVGCGDLSGDGDNKSGDGSTPPSSGGGSPPVTKITIKNDTSVDLNYLWIKPSTSTNWGDRTFLSISSGQSKEYTLRQSLSANSVYDIQLSTDYYATSGSVFIRYNVLLSNGATIIFTNGNLDSGNNFPQITIRNRSGVSLGSLQLKPSSATDWGTDFGSVSNNSEVTITIPIPLTNYSVFDIKMTSSDTNGSGIYSRSNVSISDGMTITFYSTDRDRDNLYPVIVIQNDTSIDLNYLWIKPPTSTNWGDRTFLSISSGQSKAIRLPNPLSTQSVYDIRLSTDYYASGSVFMRNNVSVADGFTVTFTNSDLQP